MDAEEVERLVLVRIGRKHASEDETDPRSSGREFRYQVLGSRMNVNTSKFRKGVPAVVAALVAHYVTTGELGVETVMVAVVNATQAMRFLNDDQLDLVQYILREAKHPYAHGIFEGDLRRSYTDAEFEFDAVLASLEKSAVLVRENGRVRLTK